LDRLLNEYGPEGTIDPGTFTTIFIHTMSDAYWTSWGNTRASFYQITGTPTGVFDGVIRNIGASSHSGEYAQYLGHYNTRHPVATDVTIELSGSQVSGPTFNIEANVCIESGGTGKSMRIQMVQVLDYYPTGGSCDPDERNCVRQGAAYQNITLAPGDCQTVSRTFTFDATSWADQENIKIIAWAQEPDASWPAEVHQAAVMTWPFVPLHALTIEFPDGLPEYIHPVLPTGITVQIEDAGETYVPGSGLLQYRYDGGDFLASTLTSLGGDLYEATLPAPGCDATPEFYISADGDDGTTVYSPEDAPASVYTAKVGIVTTILDDDFEADLGWTVENDSSLTDGAWERAIPGMDTDRGAPPEDYDGSGYCYVTDDDYRDDVDGGPTRMISPTFNLGDATDPILRFAYWWSNDDQDSDPFDIEISNDNGDTWIMAMTISNVGYPVESWSLQDIDIAAAIDPLPLTSEMKVRFSVVDDPISASVDEGGVDAVEIFDVECGVPCQAGDIDCNGELNDLDVVLFVNVLLGTETDPDYIDRSDLNDDGETDGKDVQPFVEAFLS
jgi:hypothetical protein